MIPDYPELDFGQPFNRGATMRALGHSCDAVILEKEDKATWLEGWKYEDEKAATPVIWRLDLGSTQR